MHDKTVVASYNRLADATAAMRDLREADFAETDLNLLASRSTREGAPDVDVDDAASSAATGAIAGGALGGAAGLAASLLGLAIPGVGPILAAGPIAAALAGVGAGAVAGGIVGAFTDVGISENDAQVYAESVRRGGAVVTVRTDEARAAQAEEILDRHDAVDIEERVAEWKRQGWAGYDPDAPELSAAQIEAEHAARASNVRRAL
ncbi:MAG TPA: hypothetical protein VII68_05130 [Casimicrobiaceae bacterium]|jgi:uncharacterized membrane protein